MSSSIEIISKNIIKLRDSLGISLKGFSELGNISPATLVNIESGEKSFRLKSLEKINEVTGVSLQELLGENFSPSKNLREKLIKKYAKNTEISVILNAPPTLQYSIKHKVLSTDFLISPKEINDIKIFLAEKGISHKGNSIHTALKRMPDLIKIEPHPSKKGTFVYSKRYNGNNK